MTYKQVINKAHKILWLILAFIVLLERKMKVIERKIITDYEEVQRIVKRPEIEYLDIGIFEHRGHRVEITIDNTQQYASVDGGILYAGKSLEDVFRWVNTELDGL